MCGRFTRFHTWPEIHWMYRLTDATETGRNTEARYNIPPTEDILFVTAGDNGNHKVREAAGGSFRGGRRKYPRVRCSTPVSRQPILAAPSRMRGNRSVA
jgi:putative SOS response-associated peptidase YedK